jgi:hypothetical protein
MRHSAAARAEVARSIGALVETLAEARARAVAGTEPGELASLLSRARRELDHADEKLLIFDRRRQRSVFRQAERIRLRIEVLEDSVTGGDQPAK